jgi:hypothetical protein
MVLQSNGHGVREKRLWCQRVTVMVLQRNGYGVTMLGQLEVPVVPPEAPIGRLGVRLWGGDGDCDGVGGLGVRLWVGGW